MRKLIYMQDLKIITQCVWDTYVIKIKNDAIQIKHCALVLLLYMVQYVGNYYMNRNE